MSATPYQTSAFIPQRGVYQFSMSIPLANIASGNILAGVKLGHNGRILGIGAFPTTVATTASKAATLTPTINGTAAAAPSIGLTTSNMGTLGANATIASASDTQAALNTFGPTDSIGIAASAVTAFVEGTATIYLLVQNTDNT